RLCIGCVGMKSGCDRRVRKSFAGGDEQWLAFSARLLKTQLTQDLLNVARRKAGPLGQLELGFNVVRVVQQYASCLIAVTPGTPCFLQIVFQRAGNLSMHNQPYIRLVDTHTEGIGSNRSEERRVGKGYRRWECPES